MYEPIRLHPDNPHYFLFRGKPTILFTSGEHYGVAMNRNFDYKTYFKTLAELGFNHTRVYTGLKRERPGEHNIDGNALAVPAEDFFCPWKRTDIPGVPDGGGKYDLDQWDEEYFAHFKEILTEAGKYGIEFEVIMFGMLHRLGKDGVGPWGICPLNIDNNINGVGDIDFWDVYTLKDPKIVEYQDRYIRKMVTELNEFDNLHFEICNEPYTVMDPSDPPNSFTTDKNMRLAWQQHVADVIWETESNLPNRHLISCNYQAGFYEITKPFNHVDLYCFHYTVAENILRNYGMNKALGMNETGILEPLDYPGQCWETVLGGMALYNMLDYTFTPGHEDGTYEPLPSNPGYTGMTGPALRAELKVVNDFVNGFEFLRMRPANDLLVYNTGTNVTCQILAEKNEQYAIYTNDTQHSNHGHCVCVAVTAADGDYSVEVFDARTGEKLSSSVETASGGVLKTFYIEKRTYDGNRACRYAIGVRRVK